MEEKYYDNLLKLIVDARMHVIKNNIKIRSADDPKRLLIGFTDDCNTWFLIRLSHIRGRKAFTGITEYVSKLFQSWIINGKERIVLANFINDIDSADDFSNYINRIIKLKAFW
ncbi:hypothetical protein UFOVP1290_2 [uncultured Caudovirales phage]|uniref:Uncharacterized protein n=1 Tax=uncultured Caudovirales phage TaxID=2100421 RepID=A0A6J5RKB1_9CAUD|nr:hypothetical protein UFOVP1290_2 [uncultured Caudovirales phage]